MKKLLSLLFVFLFFSASANAYLVGGFSKSISQSKPAHIFIIGYSHGMGKQFLYAAYTAALRVQENFPEQQIIFIKNVEKKTAAEVAEMERLGINVLKENSYKLKPEVLIEEIGKYSIASLEFFTHNHILYGAALEGLRPNQRFNNETPGLDKIKGRFTRDAYIFFHGCNAGFVIAPALSRILKVPAAGALTSTSIQNLKAISNCKKTECIRLYPDRHPYSGVYGTFSLGLGFYKFFCNYEDNSRCYRTMALSLFSFPSKYGLNFSSSIYDFEDVLKDFFCPIDSTESISRTCLDAVENYAYKKLPKAFLGNTPICNLNRCDVGVVCKNKCKVFGVKNKDTNQVREEYELYLMGYLELSKKINISLVGGI